jgi:hypothetical protein
MPIVHQCLLQRKHLLAKPDTLFVYGDVLEGEAILGARECRGEPNAVAIPAMRNDKLEEGSYFKDADLEGIKPAIQEAFRRLSMHAMGGGEVCFPNNGVGHSIGGGLRQRAPAIDAYLTKCYRHLMSLDIQAMKERGVLKDDPTALRRY